MTFDEIKTKYPTPVQYCDCGKCYCVGGAFMRGNVLGMACNRNFPPVEDLAEALEEYNDSLSEEQAMKFAQLIVNNNDLGDFDLAWSYLKKAMGE